VARGWEADSAESESGSIGTWLPERIGPHSTSGCLPYRSEKCSVKGTCKILIANPAASMNLQQLIQASRAKTLPNQWSRT